ncbi:DUF6527 family protein [Hydrogenophaga sp.]|uniref:DUF6527 family protein n=1 Tax=Hydrogenophaga sp. TaxID=1904254 RepID=UPI00391D9628
MKQLHMTSVFVEEVPTQMQPGVLYVSMGCATAMHLCACGCGAETVTPLSPTDWVLFYDGEAVTLYPSIGNWSLPCRSHYFIEDGKVVWAAPMSDSAINRGRSWDRIRKAAFYAKQNQKVKPVLTVEEGGETTLKPRNAGASVSAKAAENAGKRQSVWKRIRSLWLGG